MFICRTYNFAGKLHNRIMDAFNKGDMETARTEQVMYKGYHLLFFFCNLVVYLADFAIQRGNLGSEISIFWSETVP